MQGNELFERYSENVAITESVLRLSKDKYFNLLSRYEALLDLHKSNNVALIQQDADMFSTICNRQVVTAAIIKTSGNLIYITNKYIKLVALLKLTKNDSNLAQARAIYKYLSEDVLSKYGLRPVDKADISGYVDNEYSVPDIKDNIKVEDVEIGDKVEDVEIGDKVEEAVEQESETPETIEKTQETVEETPVEETAEVEVEQEGEPSTVDEVVKVQSNAMVSELEGYINNIFSTRGGNAPFVFKIAWGDIKREDLYTVMNRLDDKNRKRISHSMDILYKDKEDDGCSDDAIRQLSSDMLESLKMVNTLMFDIDKNTRREFYNRYNKLCYAIHSKSKDDKVIITDNLSPYSIICNDKAVKALITPISVEKFREDFTSLYDRLKSKESVKLGAAKELATDFNDSIKKYNGTGVIEEVNYEQLVNVLNNFKDIKLESAEEKSEKASGVIKSILSYANKTALNAKPLIQEVVLPTTFAALNEKIQNIKFSDEVKVDENKEKEFIKVLNDSLMNFLIENDTIGLRLKIHEVSKALGGKKLNIVIDESIVDKLNSHHQLEYALSSMFSYSVGDGSIKEVGTKILIAIACSAMKYIIKNVNEAMKEEEVK